MKTYRCRSQERSVTSLIRGSATITENRNTLRTVCRRTAGSIGRQSGADDQIYLSTNNRIACRQETVSRRLGATLLRLEVQTDGKNGRKNNRRDRKTTRANENVRRKRGNAPTLGTRAGALGEVSTPTDSVLSDCHSDPGLPSPGFGTLRRSYFGI